MYCMLLLVYSTNGNLGGIFLGVSILSCEEMPEGGEWSETLATWANIPRCHFPWLDIYLTLDWIKELLLNNLKAASCAW